ncbi:hypothetical protein FV219_02575 [Methylobacterium sp. WL122]|nr:hypothetical protein FV219_02575 [Methylobacterium sp. WL122]
MEIEPRPVEFRHAFLGGVLIVGSAYIGGGAIWSWLVWPDQHLDAPRLVTLLLAWVAITGGWTLIQMWREGDWFKGRKYGNSGSSNSSDSSTGSSSGCDSGTGGSDGGSCSV